MLLEEVTGSPLQYLGIMAISFLISRLAEVNACGPRVAPFVVVAFVSAKRLLLILKQCLRLTKCAFVEAIRLVSRCLILCLVRRPALLLSPCLVASVFACDSFYNTFVHSLSPRRGETLSRERNPCKMCLLRHVLLLSFAFSPESCPSSFLCKPPGPC